MISGHQITHLAGFLGLGATLLVMFAAFPAFSQSGWLASHWSASLWCALVWVVGYLAIIQSDQRRLWSPAAIFFVIFAFFHFGLAIMVLLGGGVDEIAWFHDREVPYAMALVGLGGIGLALGSIAPMVLRVFAVRAATALRAQQVPTSTPSEVLFTQLVTQIGAAVAIACILGWIMMTVIASGGRLFGLNYGEFLLATEGYPRPWLTFGIAIGVSLTAIDVSQRLSRVALGAFVVWALIALPIGVRGDVMFPAAGALAAQGWRLRAIPARYFLVGAVVMLSFASLLREIRMEGVSKVDWRWEVINPANTMRELGQSLRPTYETIRWIDDGDQFLEGASFWSPIERGFLRLFPIQDREVVDEDRQMTVLVFQRVGPIGFSPVAEAYYNFGVVGVPLVMAIIGLIVCALGMAGATPVGRAAMLATLVPLLIFVRNSFTQVPGQIVIGLSLVAAVWLLTSAIVRRYGIQASAVGGEKREPASPVDQNRPI